MVAQIVADVTRTDATAVELVRDSTALSWSTGGWTVATPRWKATSGSSWDRLRRVHAELSCTAATTRTMTAPSTRCAGSLGAYGYRPTSRASAASKQDVIVRKRIG